MIDDETLMAYADGELAPAERRAVEAAAAGDPDVAARLAAHAALREKMATAFDDVLRDPVPPRLSIAAGGGVRSGAVIDFAAARAGRRSEVKPKVSPVMGGALAACLVAGVFLGAGLETLRPAALISGRGGSLQAQGPLVTALNTQLSASQAVGRPIRIGVSFRNAKNEYCRTFRLNGDGAVAGVACRNSTAWSVDMATTASVLQGSGGYRTASSEFPSSVMRTVQDISVGGPLDADGEARAKAAGWRN